MRVVLDTNVVVSALNFQERHARPKGAKQGAHSPSPPPIVPQPLYAL